MEGKRIVSLPLPLASVIIPVYNKSATVARTIASVKAQTLSNLECIIVDDGSTDNSKDVVLEAIKDDRRFRYIHQHNSRVAAARNHGFRESKGIYICCLDGDDAIAPTFLEVCVKALQQDPSLGIAYTGLHYVLPDGKEGDSPWPGEFNYDDSLTGKTQIPTCNVARREVWERTGGQRGRYCVGGAGEEDAEMWLRVGALGWGAKKATNECLFIYSWQSGQVSGNPQHKMSDYRAWHPWVQDNQHPFASLATPKKHSHEVRQFDEPVVSVVIPCGSNHAQYLPDALDSLEAQTFRKWEAIVVCDGWKEANKDLLTAYPFVRWEVLDGKGAGAARNLGASIARGTFLLFLDADDWLRPNAITRMLQAWQQSESIIYSDYAGHAYIDNQTEIQKLSMRGRLESYNEKTKEAVVIHQSFDYDCEQAIQQPRIAANGQFYIWNLITSLVPRRWHEEIGGFDESMQSWEDWDYWLRMARTGKCFTRITEPLVDYRFFSGTRRETGRQIHETLLQYMTEKYKEQKAMPCGSCGKKRAAPPPAAMPAMMPQMSSQMSADNMIWVRLNDNQLGDHPIVGFVTKIKYGYRSHGDLFKMHKDDVSAVPHKFTAASDPNAVPVNATVAPVATTAEPPKPIAAPEPVKAAEFATWPKEKRTGRPKKVK